MRWNWMELPTMQSIAKLTISRRNGFCLAHAHLTAVGSVWILRALLLVLDICTPTKLARFIIQQYDWPRALIRSTNLYTMIKNMTSVLKRGNLNTGKLTYVYDNKNTESGVLFNQNSRRNRQGRNPESERRRVYALAIPEGVLVEQNTEFTLLELFHLQTITLYPDNHNGKVMWPLCQWHHNGVMWPNTFGIFQVGVIQIILAIMVHCCRVSTVQQTKHWPQRILELRVDGANRIILTWFQNSKLSEAAG